LPTPVGTLAGAKRSLGVPVEVRTTELKGVLVLKSRRFVDARGYFVEAYSKRVLHELGITTKFVQDNHSFSIHKGTIRGLHCQLPPAPQAKLVRVIRGLVYDVAVDLRLGSPTFGQWIAEQLSADGGEQMYVPQGFAHGFCTLEADTEVAYKVDGYYAPAYDSGIIWNDATLNIPWPVQTGTEVLSEKDTKLCTFKAFASPFHYERSDA
jgi:dTDP-4-dehydrorhamnose 3,5-epimerase